MCIVLHGCVFVVAGGAGGATPYPAQPYPSQAPPAAGGYPPPPAAGFAPQPVSGYAPPPMGYPQQPNYPQQQPNYPRQQFAPAPNYPQQQYTNYPQQGYGGQGHAQPNVVYAQAPKQKSKSKGYGKMALGKQSTAALQS